MTFDVTADAYGRFMGRFSEPLAERFVALADVGPGQRALDVGCGPGALTARLVQRLGASSVAAVDPSSAFVAAVRERLPDVDARQGGAERLPFDDATFDAAMAQLVVHFMGDPVAGVREMARVTRPGGSVAACVWDHAGGSGPLAAFWTAVRDLDPGARDESALPGARAGDLEALFERAGLRDVEPSSLTVQVDFATFQQWWEPFTYGVGPAGAHVTVLDEARRELLRRHCEELLGRGPFTISASAWCARGRP